MKNTIILLISGFFFMYAFLYTAHSNNTNTEKKYYLDIPDSPNVANIHLELDDRNGDTAYFGWYENDNNNNTNGDESISHDYDTTVHLVKYIYK